MPNLERGRSARVRQVFGEQRASAVFARIAKRGALFVSCGDTSGTYVKEQEMYEKAGIDLASEW